MQISGQLYSWSGEKHKYRLTGLGVIFVRIWIFGMGRQIFFEIGHDQTGFFNEQILIIKTLLNLILGLRSESCLKSFVQLYRS